MIPDATIHAAAYWLAVHHWEPSDDRIAVPGWVLHDIRYERHKAALMRAENRCPDADRFGGSAPCKAGRRGERLQVASVSICHVRGRWCIFGYLPGETRPGFIFPPDLAEAFRARWAAQLELKSEPHGEDSPPSPR